MRVCILGAGGVFGNNLAHYLLSQNHEVMGIGRSPRKQECFSLGVEYPYHSYHLTYELEYVLTNIDKFAPHVIVNFAAQGEGAASWGSDNWRFYETNAVGLVRLVSELMKRSYLPGYRNAYLNRFIQIGSSEVYGSVNEPVSERSPLNPTSPYSVSKAAFDLHLKCMFHVKQFPMNIIRPSNCFGPGQQLHRIIPKALICGLTGKKLPLHGGGIALKSYLHATDLSKAILLVAEKGTIGETYNVGPDNPTAIKEVVARCSTALNIPFEELCELAPERTGQDSCYWLDSTQIKNLGWRQEIDWDSGLFQMIKWIKDYPELLTMDTEYRMRA